MFGWLKRKAAKEHFKLVHQTYLAAMALDDLFGDLFIVEQALESCPVYQSKLDDGGCLTPENVDELLKMNMDMRRLYDVAPGSRFKAFDKACVPSGGWDEYFAQHAVLILHYERQ